MIIGHVRTRLVNGETTLTLSLSDRPMLAIDPPLHPDDELLFGRRLREIPGEQTGPEHGFYGAPQLHAIADLIGGAVEMDADYVRGLKLDEPRPDIDY